MQSSCIYYAQGPIFKDITVEACKNNNIESAIWFPLGWRFLTVNGAKPRGLRETEWKSIYFKNEFGKASAPTISQYKFSLVQLKVL